MILFHIPTLALQLFGMIRQEKLVAKASLFPFNFSDLKERRLDTIELNQLGNDLYGAPGLDYQSSHTEFGTTVILSQTDGSRIAVGAPLHGWTTPFQNSSQFASKESGGVFLYNYVSTLSSSQWELLWFLTGDPGEKIGSRFSLAADGTRVAVRRYNTNPSSVQVYDIHSDGKFNLVGSQINSFANGDTVTLSPDGKRLAVSSESFNKSAGCVEIYELDTVEAWRKVGTIDCNTNMDTIGTSIQQQRCGWITSFSLSGDRLAISSPNYSSDGVPKRGRVQVYNYVGLKQTWKQLGRSVIGLHADDRLGFSMSLSSDGTSLVVGIPGGDGDSFKRGVVQVFHFINEDWVQKGDIMQGQIDNDRFGRSVSISHDGNRIAASSYMHDQQRGQLRVFQYSGESENWVQVGTDIDGDSPRDRFGFGIFSVTMTGTGDRVASGSIFHRNSYGLSTGRVRVFGDSELSHGLCGFPIDMLAGKDPFENLEMTCNDAARTSGECRDTFFFSAYQCEWINGRCTSNADETDEDSECPIIVTKTRCESTTWSGPRRCIWYSFNDRAPPPAPEWDTNSAYCGYPVDFIDGTDDPFAKPRQPCHTTAQTHEVCTNSSFLAVYECFWEDGRCTSQAVHVAEDATCSQKDSQNLCDESKWVGSRACFWYDEESSALPQGPSSRLSLPPSSRISFSAKPTFTSTASESSHIIKGPIENFQPPVSQPIMIELPPHQMPILSPNENSISPSIQPPSDAKTKTQSPLSYLSPSSHPASDKGNNFMSPIIAPTFSNAPMGTKKSLQPTTNPTFWFEQKPTPMIQISFAPTIDGDNVLTACQCDTSLRKCIDEPVREDQSLYICLSISTQDENNSVAEFVAIRDITIVQAGELSDTVIRHFTSNLLTFVSVEEKHASIRTELKPRFYSADTVDHVSVEGVVIIAQAGKRLDLQKRKGGDNEHRFETATIEGNFQFQVGLVPSLQNTQSVTITVEQPDDDETDPESTAWSWKGLATIFTAVGLSIFLLIRHFIKIRSRRVPPGISRTNGGDVQGQGTPIQAPAVMSMGFSPPAQTFMSPVMMVPTSNTVTASPNPRHH